MPPASLAMAGAHCSTTSFLIPSANATPVSRKPVISVSSISTPSPAKLTKRRNYLRPKLLKILRKPNPNPFLPESSPINPIIPFEVPQESGDSCPTVTGEELKESESHEFQLSETSAAIVTEDGVRSFSPRSVVKIGLYLVGAFVFQTICAVWILGSANFDHTDGNLDSEDKLGVVKFDSIGNNEAKKKFRLNGSGNSFRRKLGLEQGGIVCFDESELEEKIVEIQNLARDAREREKLESEGNGSVDADDDDDDDVFKTGIGKEVDSRLVKLRKRLQNIRDKPLVSSDNYLRKDKIKDGVKRDELDAKEANGDLMFKKKYKFKSPSIDSSNKPKGFQVLEDHGFTKMKSSSSASGDQTMRNGNIGDSLHSLAEKQLLDLADEDMQGRISVPLKEENGGKPSIEENKSMPTPRKSQGKARGKTKLTREMGAVKPEPEISIAQETSGVRHRVEAVKSVKSSKLEAQNSQSLTKENQDTTTISNKRNVPSKNGSLKNRGGGSKQAAKKVGNKKSESETEWWLSLPYVLAILMCKDHDGEGPQGLFTLKSTSHTKGDLSHTVVFEDRGDATNFCYVLQSFFEDLDGFTADIVPLSTEELDGAVKSRAKKILAVKKGQLQLYAGQPLADVETALHSLVGQR